MALISDLNSLVIGVLALTVALAAGYWMFTRAQDESDLAPVSSSPGTAENLMDAIIVLDDRFEKSELDEAQYQTERQALKDQLRGMME